MPRSSGGQAVLEAFMATVVEDDYPDVPSEASRPRRGRGDAWGAASVAAMIGLVIMLALATTLSTSDARKATEQALASRIESTTQSVTARQSVVDAQRDRVDELQARLLAADDAQPASEERIASLRAVTGTSPLSGPGLSITMDDALDAKAGSLNRVLDRDLQDVVNVVWQSGATGIAVNGHRLTGATAIRSAGDAILVDYAPIARPYVVTAVGGNLAGAVDSSVRRLLSQLTEDYGLVTSVSEADVALPAGELREPRVAVPVEGSLG